MKCPNCNNSLPFLKLVNWPRQNSFECHSCHTQLWLVSKNYWYSRSIYFISLMIASFTSNYFFPPRDGITWTNILGYFFVFALVFGLGHVIAGLLLSLETSESWMNRIMKQKE